MKLAVILIIACLVSAIARSQVPSWVWAKSGANTATTVPRAVAADGAGNIYAVGTYSGTISFGAASFTSLGQSNMYLLKYGPAGNLIWARNVRDSGMVKSSALAVDANGNVYVAGYFTRTAVFESTAVTSVGGEDLFLAKYRPDGTLEWVRAYGSEFDDAVEWGIGIDSRQNIVISGYFGNGGISSSIFFDRYFLTSSNGTNIFIVKYDSAGQIIWAKQAGNTSSNYAFDLAVDKQDNIFIAGTFEYKAYFDQLVINTSNEGFVGGGAFLVKYDSSGTAQWAASAGGRKPGSGTSGGAIEGMLVTVDADGNPIIGGNYKDCDLKIGGLYLPPTDYSVGTRDMWLAKYSAAGAFQWARVAGSIDPDYLWDMASDQQGNVYITGEYGDGCAFGADTAFLPDQNPNRYAMFICKYNSSGGVDWLHTTAVNRGTTGRCLAFNKSGELIVGGGFAGPSLNLGPSTVTNGSTFNGFIGKMGASTAVKGQVLSADGFIVYPNPARDEITIRLKPGKKFSAYKLSNSLGQLVASGVLGDRSSQQISLADVAAGLYYLQLTGSSGIATQRFCIRR